MSSDSPKVTHRPKIPFDYNSLREDAATLYVNNKVFYGFKSISVKKNLMKMAGSFELTITDVWQPDGQFEIKPGDRVHCHLGKEAIFEGYVDTFTISITSGSRNITIAGRDRTADLIDCSVDGKNEYNDLDLGQLATEMIKPFGLKVINPFSVSLGAKFQKFTIRQGETIFEALSRAAKSRQIILLTSTHGNLILDKRGQRRSGTDLVEGVNIEMTGASFDNSSRFSSYVVKGQQPGILGDIGDAIGAKGSASDSGVKRYRPTIIISEQSSDGVDAQKRAEYEASYRSAKSFSCTGTVNDWKKRDGKLWQVNELVRLKARSIGIDSELLISAITFSQNENGRKTDLDLIRKDAFEFEKNKKESDDILSTLGWK